MALFKFQVGDQARFKKLQEVFEVLKGDKERDARRSDSEWSAILGEQATRYFWHPSPAEFADWHQAWIDAPVDRRSDEASPPGWTLSSMIDAFMDGDYELIACRKIGQWTGVIEFEPHGYPFGGTECMEALVEAFGFRVLLEDTESE